MPAESQRLRHRLTGRDRWFLALLLVLAVVGTPTAVVVLRGDSHSTTDARCVTVNRAFIMGGGDFKYCGAAAAKACRRYASEDKAVAARCEALGLP